jgi:hypothetical protein
VRRAITLMTAAVAWTVGATPGVAQRVDSLRAPIAQASFVGFITNATDKSPVRTADVRLYYIDSMRTIREPVGGSSVETFVDTTRSRLRVSDSTGYFAIWHLAAGRYVMSVRRLGFSPSEAIVTVDSTTVLYDFTMVPNIPMLASVEIRETSMHNSAARRLERVGFTNRTHFEDALFVKQTDIMKRQPQTVRDILGVYGIHDAADFILDRMPLDYYDVADYPADLIAGIEIYRHGRPMEYNQTRVLEPNRTTFVRPLVLIWTYIP